MEDSMDWTEIAITVPAEDVDRAGDIAQMVVPYGIYIEDYSNLEQEAWEIAHIDLIDEELLNKFDEILVLKDGFLEETGSYQQLIEKGNFFRKLVEAKD